MLAATHPREERKANAHHDALPALARLNSLLIATWQQNRFYSAKWSAAGLSARPLETLHELSCYPLTTRAELIADQNGAPPLGSHLNCRLHRIMRVHRSSGTSKEPIYWGDDAASWDWIIEQSRYLFRLAGVSPDSKLFFALPFGASSGPWILHEGARSLGCGCFTVGTGIIQHEAAWVRRFQPDTIMGKPHHLLALAALMESDWAAPAQCGVKKLILTGQSVSPEMRTALQERWGGECFDRYGMTEAGSIAGECSAHSGGLHLRNTAFIAETVDPETGEPMAAGELGELVLTTLGRAARPIIRYRTGDLVRLCPKHVCSCGITGPFLVGGVQRQEKTNFEL